MEVKRAFRCYRGPDDPGPFSDIINSMSFGCRHMKEYNKNGVFCLTAKVPEGYVKVMRVGDVDYIWTEGGASAFIYIILIPDLKRGFRIPVTLKKGDYTFGEIETLDGTESMTRYQFDANMTPLDGVGVSREYMPYIFKMLDYSHVSVGYPGSLFYPDPVNDWHNKFYVLDCTGDQSSLFETLWRPPSQVATVGFGEDLLPVWYAMSPITAHNFHWCFEACIDQSKRTYQPVNTDVLLVGEEVPTPAGFTLVQRSYNRYNFLYPLQASRFYGKNAFDVDAARTITAFGESIYVSGVGEYNVPVDIDPILFFWPWIPYLDEIRSFNILYYGGRSLPFDGGFEGWFMTPSLDSFKKHGIGYYTNAGAYQTAELFEDVASFSNVTKSTNTENAGGPIGCDCGDCATGSWQENKTAEVPVYNSSGTKNIPIGLIGGRIPIYMKTMWQQSGSGPVSTDINTDVITGTYPWGSLHSGSLYGLGHWYETCCRMIFHNDHNRIRSYVETANNQITLTQTLMVGDDVIFSGESSMHYDMEYNYEDSYHGTVHGTVAPEGQEVPVCIAHINYTTQQMSVNQTQNLSWTDETNYPEYAPCEDQWKGFDLTWSLSGGGSLSSTTESSIVYTAPATNPNCTQNVTISLLCDGTVVDTLEIAITSVTTGLAYRALSCRYEGSCDQSLKQTIYQSAYVWIDRYSCDGTYLGHESSVCYVLGGVCQPPKPLGCEECAATQHFTACGVVYDNSGRSSCEGAALKCGTLCIYGLPPGASIGEPLDSRTPAQKAAGCCPAALL